MTRKTGKTARILPLLLALLLALSLAGCAAEGAGKRVNGGTSAVKDVLENGMKGDAGTENAGRASNVAENAPAPETAADPGAAKNEALGIDVDLTSLSGTMVYSQVYAMMTAPQDYVGKTVRMKGNYTEIHDPETKNTYYACVVQDATACCAQGIEFVPTGAYAYPADYPKEGDAVTVTGVFDTYVEGQYLYCTLRDAVMD